MAKRTAIPANLADSFLDRVRTFAVLRTADASAAAAVAEETLGRVVEAMLGQRIRSLDSVPDVVFETAREVCLLYQGSSAPAARAESGSQEKNGTAGEADPLTALVGQRQQVRVLRAFDELSVKDRALLEMFYRRGLAMSVIAHNLGLSPSDVRHRRDRALRSVGGYTKDVRTEVRAGPGSGPACPGGDETREYTSRRLGRERMEAYERHYFNCDDCWNKLRSVIAVRAALARRASSQPAEPTGLAVPAPVPRRELSLRWVAWTAVFVVSVALSLLLMRPNEPSASELAALEAAKPPRESEADRMSLRVRTASDRIVPSWRSVPGAHGYVVELWDAEGKSLLRQETDATSLEVSRQRVADQALFYLRVQALDPLERVMVSSERQGISLAPPAGP